MFTLSTILLAAASLAPQQQIVSPAHFANAEAPSRRASGIGTTRSPSTLLSIHDELQGTARTIRGVALRLDGEVPGGQSGQQTFVVNVFASTAATTAANPDATFVNNHGPDKVQVTTFALAQIAPARVHGFPAPFELVIPFNRPFAFGGNGPLCLEIQVITRTNSTNYNFDFVSFASSNPRPETRSFGSGCQKASGGGTVVLNPSSSSNWSANTVTLSYNGQRLDANQLVGLIIGGSNTSFSGLPLPFALPNTAGAPSGTCRLYTDIVVQIPGFTNSNGQVSWNLSVPVTTASNGASLFGQVLQPDAAANPWGVVLSNAAEHHVVAPYPSIPVGTVYNDSSTGPTGTVLKSAGYVMRFDV